MEAFGIFEYARVVTRKGNVKANPTPSNPTPRDIADDPQPTTLSFYAKYRGSHLCGANARRRNRCKMQKRTTLLLLCCPRALAEFFMKVLTEEEQVQQGVFLWGGTTANSQVGGLSLVLWPLDFNDGPVISLCQPTV